MTRKSRRNVVQRKLSTQAEIYTPQYFAIETIENLLVIGAQISLPLDGGSQEGSGGEGVDVGELGLLDAVRRVALHQVLPLPHVHCPWSWVGGPTWFTLGGEQQP